MSLFMRNGKLVDNLCGLENSKRFRVIPFIPNTNSKKKLHYFPPPRKLRPSINFFRPFKSTPNCQQRLMPGEDET